MVYTICIGSNEQRHVNLAFARRRLEEAFPGIRFSHEEETVPLAFHRNVPFSNQVARFTSNRAECEVCTLLKEIEREAGRRPAEKEREIIRLDIDLLACDSQVYRQEDWGRDYVQRGVKELETAFPYL